MIDGCKGTAFISNLQIISSLFLYQALIIRVIRVIIRAKCEGNAKDKKYEVRKLCSRNLPPERALCKERIKMGGGRSRMSNKIRTFAQ